MTELQADLIPSSTRPIFRFEQVGVKAALGSRYLLRGLTFSVMEGDRLAIVGPSGAGKTSLLRLMNRLSDASEGQIMYGDRPIQSHDVMALRQAVPFLLQEPRLLGQTVAETLAYPLHLRQMQPKDIEQRVRTWAERLHVPPEWMDRTETQLSVGQRQLVAITRALVIQPKILLMDEPTSALDVGRRAHLLDVLKTYAEATPCTIVMVSHDLDLAQHFCSKLLHLAEGCKVQHAAVEDIDWTALKNAIVEAEQQQQSLWDEDDADVANNAE